MALLTVKEVAAILGITPSGVHKLIKRGRLKATRVGHTFVSQWDFEAYCRQPVGRPKKEEK